jgi:protein-S-isoprenylcysteine O-methyltransferase Ste14
MLSWREPIVQLAVLIVVMLGVSFLNVSWISSLLAVVRMPLLLMLLVAVAYQVWLVRQAEQATVIAAQDDSRLIERERGA